MSDVDQTQYEVTNTENINIADKESTQDALDDLSLKILSTKQKLDELKRYINNLSDSEKNKIDQQELQKLKDSLEEYRRNIEKLKRNQELGEIDQDKITSIEVAISDMESDYRYICSETSGELSKLSKDIWSWKNIVHTIWWLWIAWWIAWLSGKIFGNKDYKKEIEWYDNMTRKEKRKARKEWKKKKRLERKEKRKEKSFWDRWYWKALIWTWIWTWIYYLYRWISSWDWSIFWRNPFSKEKKEWPSTTPWSPIESSEKNYDKLWNSDKQIYEDSATAINEYQQNIMWDENWSKEVEDLMWDSDFDSNKAWLIPFILSNRYASLDKMLSETSLYYEIIWKEWHIAWNKIKDWGGLNEAKDRGLDKLKMLLMPLVWVVNWLTLDLLNLDEWWDKLIEKLKSIDGLEEKLGTIFRKSITVMSYYQSRKWALESKLAREELAKQNPEFATLSEEDQAEEISDCLQNDERYKQHIEPEVSKFMWLNLKDATTYLKSKDLLNWEIDPLMKLSMDKIEKWRMNLLNIENEDDTSIVNEIKNELWNWKLSERWEKKLRDLCDMFKDEVFTFGKQRWYAKYFPMFKLLGADSNFIEDIQKTWDYENIANRYKEQVDIILKKSEDGNMDESDLDLLEETINDYYKFQKSLVSSEINVWKMVDENWNLVLKRWRSIVAGWKNIYNGVEIVIWKKEGSRKWEAALLIGWWILSVDALTFWIAGKKLMWFSPFWTLNERVVFPVAKSWLRLTWQGIERLTWQAVRANLPSWMSYNFYNVDTFRLAVWRGEISLEKAARIARRKWFTFWQIASWNGKLIETPEHVVQYLFWLNAEDARRVTNIVSKYWDNPQIYQQLFPEYYDKVIWARRKPKELLHLNRANMKFEPPKPETLKTFEDIIKRIDGMKEWTEKTIMQSMMKSVKTIDQAQDLAIMWVGDDMIKVLESWKFMKAEQYGKYLAKYASNIDPNDLRALEKFIVEAKTAWKAGEDTWLFVRNAMKNFAKIKENGFAVDKIDDLALNWNRRTRLSETTKANCAKMTSRLKEMAKNPKFKPFSSNIAKQAEAVEDFSKTITPDWMKAIKNMGIFWKETAFAKLSTEWMHELSRLSYMLRDVDMATNLTKALKWAKTLDNVKDVLKQSWIIVDNIDDAVLLKIAKSWNARTISDIVNYGAWYNTIKWAEKFLQNPAVKQAWRVAGATLVVLDFLMVWYNFYSQYNQSQTIKQYNMERWERKEWQAYFELATWGVWALAWAGMLIPSLMAIPWVWWILWWAIAASIGVGAIWNKYFKDIEKFKQNQADFLSKWIITTKQELVSVDSWNQGLSRTWIDKMNLFNSKTKKEIWSPKTKAEALKALIKMEELQKNPLAWADLNDPEIIKDPNLAEAIRLAKQQTEEIVQKRFEYFKQKYLNENKPLIDKSQFFSNQTLSTLEYELQLSSINATMNDDTSYEWEKDPEKYLEAKLNKLRQWNEWNFNKLEKLFNDNPISLFQMYAELPYYRSMLSQYWDGNYEKTIESCKYFEEYMSCKMMWKSVSLYPDINMNPDNIDYNQIHNLLSHFSLVTTTFTPEQSENYKWISDNEILENYWISGILWQDILFECAKLLNYNWKNSLDELKLFFHESKKEVHGIYYNWEKWVINEKTRRDDKIAEDSELNSLDKIKDMRKHINSNANSWWNWKMFNESSYINVEIWNKMLKIIDEYISLREGDTIKKWIENYVKVHGSSGNYISLPYDLIIKWRKAGLEWVGQHLYKYENWIIIKK